MASFADEVEWGMALDRLVGSGVKIISHSIGFDNIYPPNGAHPFAAKVDAVAAAGVLFVSAAGNEGGNYFQGPWQDTNNNEFLEFGGRTEFLPIGGGEVTARLRWDDSYGTAAHDYDLYIVSSAFRDNPDPNFPESDNRILARSEDLQNNSGNPLESLSFESKDEVVYAVIHHDPGTPRSSSQRLWLWTSGGVSPEFFAPAGSLTLPADARGALTVGAMEWSSLALEGFSSRGPTSDGRAKPDLAGPDGVETASYKGEPFYGTSAATPHAAGAAALLLSRTPSMNLAALRLALERATTSGGGSKNNDTGAGLIDLLR